MHVNSTHLTYKLVLSKFKNIKGIYRSHLITEPPSPQRMLY